MDARTGTFDNLAFEPLSGFVGGLADAVGLADGLERGLGLTVEDLGIQLPVELRFDVDSGGSVRLSAAPPQRTETSWAPVLNSLSIRVVVDDGR